MHEGRRVLALIPARGGSKGLPRKNLKRIGGRSLVEWAIDVGRACPAIDRLLVSTDDKAIARQANRRGPYAPFLRPAELATDTAPSLPVFQHAYAWAEAEDDCRYDLLLLLEPPSPFRLPAHLLQGLDIAVRKRASSVMSLTALSDTHPIRVKKLDADGAVRPYAKPEPEGLRRQDQEPAFLRNCAVYVFPRETVFADRLYGDRPYGFDMDRAFYGINIDEETDLVAARFLYRRLAQEGRLALVRPPLPERLQAAE